MRERENEWMRNIDLTPGPSPIMRGVSERFEEKTKFIYSTMSMLLEKKKMSSIIVSRLPE